MDPTVAKYVDKETTKDVLRLSEAQTTSPGSSSDDAHDAFLLYRARYLQDRFGMNFPLAVAHRNVPILGKEHMQLDSHGRLVMNILRIHALLSAQARGPGENLESARLLLIKLVYSAFSEPSTASYDLEKDEGANKGPILKLVSESKFFCKLGNPRTENPTERKELQKAVSDNDLVTYILHERAPLP